MTGLGSEVPAGVCAKPGCTAPMGGPCLEGIPRIEECPHYNADGEEAGVEALKQSDQQVSGYVDTQQSEAETTQPVVAMVQLLPGTKLSAVEALTITTQRRTHVVVIAGMEESGKTTLVESLYERLLFGPVAGYLFAGSRTLRDFEIIAHDARTDSGRPTPTTARTIGYDGVRYLHLALASNDEIRDILFTDVSGEVFLLMRDDARSALDAVFMRRADHVIVLLDGELLASRSERHRTVFDAFAFVQSCLAAGVIDQQTILRLVTSKWDLIDRGADKSISTADTIAFVERTETDFVDKFAPFFNDLGCFRTAARDPEGVLPPGFGVDPLLLTWFSQGRMHDAEPQEGVRGTRREFAMFAEREGL